MALVIYILLLHLNFALTGFILFTKKIVASNFLVRLCLIMLNLWLSEWTPFFCLLLYFYNAAYIFYETKNTFIVFLLNTFCVNFIGISVFFTIEIPRFLEDFHLVTNLIPEILCLLVILVGIRKLDQTYRITTYLYAYRKKRIFSTLLIIFLFVSFFGYHMLFPLHSLDYILTSFILITTNFFYGLLMVLILLNEKKEEHYVIYMESMKKK